MNVNNPAEHIRYAELKYNSYDPAFWERAYFDKYSGGFNVYHKAHQFCPTGGGGEAEKVVGRLLARLGKHVEFLPENGKGKGVPDLHFDGHTWDVKFINRANVDTIRTYIKDAGKANNAIFYWAPDVERIEELRNAIKREVGRMRRLGRLYELPNVYYFDKNGLIRTAWKK